MAHGAHRGVARMEGSFTMVEVSGLRESGADRGVARMEGWRKGEVLL